MEESRVEEEEDEEEEKEEEGEGAEAARPLALSVGGWGFSLPRSKLAPLPWKEEAEEEEDEEEEEEGDGGGGGGGGGGRRLFLDADGLAFRHLRASLRAPLHGPAHANHALLQELAHRLRLQPRPLQTLDNLKEGKHNLRIRPSDIPIAERASMNYWRTRKCISKPPELPPKNPALTGLQEKAPLGLMDTPLLDTEEEVHYCFLPLDLVEKHPALVNDDNLLWLSDNAALVECENSEFRFIANFLRSERLLLPDDFSHLDALEAEAEALDIPEINEALKAHKALLGLASEEEATGIQVGLPKGRAVRPSCSARGPKGRPLALFPMALGLLVKYPDSALGQLHMEGSLDRSRLYVSGNGVLFQHVRNWLGICRLPLTRTMSELPELCAYLDQMDVTYEPMKEALKIYLKQGMPTDTRVREANWAADVTAFSPLHIVKVYAGSHWYATYLQTLLKFPELLSNSKKAIWIAFGHSLLIHGDGKMFRHILNFFRLGKLFLPVEFKEWALLRQEAAEFQIPSLLEALHQHEGYRLWLQQREGLREAPLPQSLEPEKEQRPGGDPQEVSVPGPWSRGRDGLERRASARESGVRPTRLSPAKAVKRQSSSREGPAPSSGEGQAPESPPRKRPAKGGGARRATGSETPIQRLISLVQGWDMVAPAEEKAEEEEEGPRRRTPCSLGVPATLQNGLKAAPAAQESSLKAGQCTTGAPESQPGKAAAEMRPSQGEAAGGGGSKGPKEMEKGPVSFEPRGQSGLILKVAHPPMVACDGSCVSHEGSLLYAASLEGLQLPSTLTESRPQDIVFLSLPLSQEEIFYGRSCHVFLTDLILESIRQKDPKGTTARIQILVQRLWGLQISAGEFVADLLHLPPFKAGNGACQRLAKWVEFSLPFAWKYSSCMELLVKKGYFQSLSHFVIGKYLQSSE
ncbi:BTB/POZ domain-containing protein KCTD19 isoform X2 [Anolis carolinensis]|uniref:BTB/POZ domain-containing protein KCTD19 isoform X2 n=1 Tax=Anolis carolinensis TaxID=28377 RepID=UPI002F2B2EB7